LLNTVSKNKVSVENSNSPVLGTVSKSSLQAEVSKIKTEKSPIITILNKLALEKLVFKLKLV
jgi:hypothetical protein